MEIRLLMFDGCPNGEKTAKLINEMAMPVSVSDEGVVVTIGASFGMNGAPIKIWDKQGKKSRTLVSGAQAATVSGGKLFYITRGEHPVIKSMPLPRNFGAKK